jgi:fucose permease
MANNALASSNGRLLSIAVAYVSFVLLGVSSASLGPLWSSHLHQAFAQPLDALGILLATNTIGYFIGSATADRIFKRLAVRLAFALCMLLSGLGFAGYALAPVWFLLVALGLLTGLGTGILDGGMNIYFAAHFNERLLNWLHAAFGVGAFVAPQLLNLIVVRREGDWRSFYGLLAGAFVLMGLLFLLMRHQWKAIASSAPNSKQESAAPSRRTFSLPIVWLGVALFVGYTGSEASAGNWGAAFFTWRGLDTISANDWVTAYWLSFTIGRIIFGLFITRLNPPVVIRLCLLASLGGLGLLALWPNMTLGVVGLVIFGFALSPIFALLISFTQSRLGPVLAPAAIGLQVAAASIGGGLMPGLVGLIVTRAGLAALPICLLVVTALMLVLYQLSLHPFFKRGLA